MQQQNHQSKQNNQNGEMFKPQYKNRYSGKYISKNKYRKHKKYGLQKEDDRAILAIVEVLKQVSRTNYYLMKMLKNKATFPKEKNNIEKLKNQINQELSSSGESLGDKTRLKSKDAIKEKYPQVDHDCQTSVIEEDTVVKDDCLSQSFFNFSQERINNINIVNNNNTKNNKSKNNNNNKIQKIEQIEIKEIAAKKNRNMKNEIEKVRSFRIIKAKDTPKLVNRSTETNDAAIHPLEFEGYKIAKNQQEAAKLKELKQQLDDIKDEVKKVRFSEQLYNNYMDKLQELDKKWCNTIHKYGWGEEDIQSKLYAQYDALYQNAINENINQDIRMSDLMQAYFTYLQIVTYAKHPTITMEKSNEGQNYIQNVKNYIKNRMKNKYDMDDIFLRATQQFPDIIHYMKVHQIAREDIFKELEKNYGDRNVKKNNNNKKKDHDKEYFTFTTPKTEKKKNNDYNYSYKTYNNNYSYNA